MFGKCTTVGQDIGGVGGREAVAGWGDMGNLFFPLNFAENLKLS